MTLTLLSSEIEPLAIPHLIGKLDGSFPLPESLLRKVDYVRENGGMESLRPLMDPVRATFERARQDFLEVRLQQLSPALHTWFLITTTYLIDPKPATCRRNRQIQKPAEGDQT